ncbi:LysR family transcriptional regulator [Nocardia sp. NPDC052566]|uniref:LysR family transcriptional regulator n=1 Tax=Nocardia sp. NPDC052566 TaxID=3364330 RepID=UPI0037C9CCED
MEIRQLRHFVALAEERSFTRAAQREHIVQSGLSSSVHALEKDIGADLYVRGTRPLRLTAEGEALVPAARHALEAGDAAYRAVHSVRGLLTGRLRIGAYQASRHLFPFACWLAEFAREHPALDIRVRQMPGTRALRMVREGELDCALVTPLPGHTHRLELVPLAAEPIVLAVPRNHRLAAFDSVELSQLNGERFIETHPEWANRITVDNAFAAAGVTREITCEVNEWAMVLDLVAAELGIAFAPAGLIAARDDTQCPVRAIPVSDAQLERRVDLAVPRGHEAVPAARGFAQFLEERRRGLAEFHSRVRSPGAYAVAESTRVR